MTLGAQLKYVVQLLGLRKVRWSPGSLPDCDGLGDADSDDIHCES